MKYLKIIAAASLLALGASANAKLHSFEITPTTGGGFGSSAIDIMSTSFDSTNQRFTWDTEFSNSAIDGFWLVVNNGDNPKNSNVNELAIMYGDLTRGILSTYIYNGQNNSNSIRNPSILLQTDSFTTTANGFSLDISTASINNYASVDPDYTGVSFSEDLGIWLHFSSNSNFTYNNNNDITDFSFGREGYYDAEDLETLTTASVEVSSPSVIALFGLAFVGLAFMRKKVS